MRTAPTILVGPIIAAMLAGMSMGVLAQDDQLPTPAHVTGRVMELTSFDDEGSEEHADDTAPESHVIGQRVMWSDPRLPSEHWIRLTLAIFDADPEAGVMTQETSHLLVDDAGAWRGTGRAVMAADHRDTYYELVGEGAYDGLHALLRGTTSADSPGPWDLEYEGWIFEGEVPGFPEPAEVATGEGMLMRMAPDPESVTSSSAVALADPMAPGPFVFMTESVGEPDWGTDHESADGSVSESRGLVQVDRVQATDPRASGLMTTWQNRTQIDSDAGMLQNWSITARLVNDDGAWSGPSQIVAASSPEVMELAGMTRLTGEGGYDGLTLFMHQAGDHLSFRSWGLIVPNELLAPMPDPVEPADE